MPQMGVHQNHEIILGGHANPATDGHLKTGHHTPP